MCIRDSNNIDYVHTLSKNRVEGAILFNYQLENKDYDAIPFPIVSIDRFVKDSVSFVASNHEQGGLLAANHLIECGCRHVIQVGGSFQELTPWNIRHVKFRETMRENGIECISYEPVSYTHLKNRISSDAWSAYTHGMTMKYLIACRCAFPRTTRNLIRRRRWIAGPP